MGTHRYKITINAAPQKPITYTYKYDKTEGIEIKISKKKAVVAFQMTTKKEHEDIISFRVRLAKDAFRKAHLLHALSFNESLTVKKIAVTIDDEERVYTNSTSGFPFFFSMMDSEDFGWKQLWKQSQIDAVLSSTKTQTENDLRYVSLFSYLAGQSKQFEIDRFICLWTAMNAHYNFILDCFDEHLKKKSNADTQADMSSKGQVRRNDRAAMSKLVRILGCGIETPSEAMRNKNAKDYGAMKDYFQQLPILEIGQFHTALYRNRCDRTYVPEGNMGSHLKKCMEHSNLSAYAFILLPYAYYLRCKYVHGNKATILFAAYHDAELAALRVVDYFLSEYLKQAIPAMFDKNYFTEAMYQKCNG